MLLLLPIILNSIGVLARDPELRIVGGKPVSIRDRPFQILIYRTFSREATPDCGGAILNHRWVVSAAHCVYGALPDNMVIRAGSDNLNIDSEASWYNVEKLIIHDRYIHEAEVTVCDIALLLTITNIAFSWNVKSINLATTSPKPGAKAIVSGFGVIEEGNKRISSILNEVSVTVLQRDDCLDLLAETSPTAVVSKTHFCAADLIGGRDACQGDSGGPLTIDDSLAGVVSWGIGCAREMVPAFYTDLAQFEPWIRSILYKNHKRYRHPCKSKPFNETINWY